MGEEEAEEEEEEAEEVEEKKGKVSKRGQQYNNRSCTASRKLVYSELFSFVL